MNASVLIIAMSTGAAAVAVQLRTRAHRLLDVACGGRGHVLGGAVLDRYLDEGGPTSALGLPVSTEHRATPAPSTPLCADRQVDFEYGTIYLDSSARRTKVVLFDHRP